MRDAPDFAPCSLAVKPQPERVSRVFPRLESLPARGWVGQTEAAMQFGVSLADVADDVEGWAAALILPVRTSLSTLLVYNPMPWPLAIATLRPTLTFDATAVGGGGGGAGIVRFVMMLAPTGHPNDRVRLQTADCNALVEWRPTHCPDGQRLTTWHRIAALREGDAVSWVFDDGGPL